MLGPKWWKFDKGEIGLIGLSPLKRAEITQLLLVRYVCLLAFGLSRILH